MGGGRLIKKNKGKRGWDMVLRMVEGVKKVATSQEVAYLSQLTHPGSQEPKD